MKRTLTALILLALIFPATAQVQIKPLPKPGFEKRIREYVDKMKVVDTHEHLMNLDQLKAEGRYGCNPPDFMLLLNVYSCDDIKSAGMPLAEFDKLVFDQTMNPLEKWRLLKPWWEASSNTAYNRGVLLTADKLFGVKTLDSTTVQELSDKIAKAYKDPKGWFDDVLKEKCNIEYVVENPWWEDRSFYNPEIFRFVEYVKCVWLNSAKEIEDCSKWAPSGIKTLDDLVLAQSTVFKEDMKRGMVAIKCGLAYLRPLNFENVPKEQAEAVFKELMDNPDRTFPFNKTKPLQDYMMHRVLDLAKANHLPVQVHTGLQGNNGNNIENSKPTLLVNLFQEYPDVKFILFHGSYPYGGELSTLAKNFRNVYIDMCWLYIISPSYSERYLNEWLETVPANKIMGFGGDYFNVEGVYGHLLFAKQVVSNVLIGKVRDGYFTEDEAINVAQMILHDNAVKILDLK